MNFTRLFLKTFFAVFIIVCSQPCLFGQTTLPDEVRIDYVAANKPLRLVLKELVSKSGININYSESRIPADKKINITAQDETIGDILLVVLKEVGYTYQIIGSQIVLLPDNSQLKTTYTISGYLKDISSGENLIHANVFLFDKSKGTQTNEDGFYSITLSRGTQRLYYSYIGYEQVVKEFFLDGDVTFDAELTPDAQLNEVIILDEVENREEETTASESKLFLDQIRTATTLGGESDIIRLVNMMPGVNTGADGLGGMNVRGGSADQNLVLLDGAPIYNPGHALGLFSVFNSDVIKSATLYKGNIPARYGGRLSSILDVYTRDGNTKRTAGGLSMSTLALKGYVEGPIGKGGSSYLVSARRTFLDPWIKSASDYVYKLNEKEGFSTYYFADVNGKLNFRLSDKTTLLLSGFVARDEFENKVEETSLSGEQKDRSGIGWNWGNNMGSLRLKTQIGNKAFGVLSGYYTDFAFQSFDFDSFLDKSVVPEEFLYKASLFESQIKDFSASYAIDYVPSTTHRIKTGVGYINHTFNPGLTNVNNKSGLFTSSSEIDAEKVKEVSKLPTLRGQEFNAYIEDEITINYSVKFNLGLHSNYVLTDTASYLSFQPRISMLAQTQKLYFKLGASRMSQYLHLVSSNGLGLPSDVWLPSTDRLAPEMSWIFSADLGYKNKLGYQWGIEGYYKMYEDLTSFDEGKTEDISVDKNWERNIPIGTGNSYGLEAYFNKIIGQTTWNANYTLSWSTYNFPDLNNGDPFPFRYDRRHNIKLGFFHRITDNTEFVLNWNYSSGNPITYPSQVVIDLNGTITPIYFQKNNRLLPVYHRVDFAFNFYSKLRWARQKFSIGLYNAFNRKNKFFIDVERSPNNTNQFEETSFSILPVFPAINYSLSF